MNQLHKIVMNQNMTPSLNPLLKKTNAYPALGVLVCPAKLSKVADIATGGMRSRKYAIVMSLSGIPNLSEQPEPIMIKNDLQTIIIDADNVEDLRDRCYSEIDGIIDQMLEVLEEIKNAKDTQKVT
jgi:hypothetical protein